MRELASLSGLDKATLLRMLGTLAAHGYVRRQEDGRYAPGPAVLRLASLYNATTGFDARMMAVLKGVMQRTEESAAFYRRDGMDRVCVCRVNAPRALRHQVEVGERLPLAAGGGAAHVLLGHTGGRSGAAQKAVAQGWLVTAGERDAGLASVTMPVFDGDGSFLGALVVSGPISRQSEAGFEQARGIVAALLREHGFSAERPAGFRPLPN